MFGICYKNDFLKDKNDFLKEIKRFCNHSPQTLNGFFKKAVVSMKR
ncbi:hypothetical protein HMPREF1426_01318 [Helicobacter pylori GAM80Ai]|nr:hypothetical protein HMPREF1426_01318 [Helicobacter pylori GAM80Ai]